MYITVLFIEILFSSNIELRMIFNYQVGNSLWGAVVCVKYPCL